LNLQFHVDLHRARPRDAVKRIFEIFALSQTLENEPIMVSQLVRTAINGIAVSDLQLFLKHADLTDDEIVRLQAVLRQYRAQQSFGVALNGERASVYTANTWPLAAQPTTRAEVEQFEGRSPRTFDAAKSLQMFRKIETANDESIQQTVVASREFEAELKQLAGTTKGRLLYMKTVMLLPAMTAASAAYARNEACFDAADAGLAAIRFRRINQVWPQQMSQLVPDLLPAIPIDPYDGQPLRVVISDNEFKVYTIGRDLIDQGGDLSLPNLPDQGFIATWREAK
jgi:hypothetical protein